MTEPPLDDTQPSDHGLIEETGPWPFVTRRVYRLADQSKRIWSSRHHRKHLILHDLSEGEALGSFLLRSLWMPMKLNWWIGVIFTIGSVLLPAFVMMSGISNNQSYSFMGIVSGALMILLGLVIVGIVQTLMGSMKSEQTMLNSVRWFFSGCARVTNHPMQITTRCFEDNITSDIVTTESTTISDVPHELSKFKKEWWTRRASSG